MKGVDMNVKITEWVDGTFDNNVKIIEWVDGTAEFVSRWQRLDFQPDEWAALREYFAAEQMPEDVQALVERVRGYLAVRDAAVPEVNGEPFDIVHDIDHGSRGHSRLNASDVRRLVAALEAAYLQKGAES